MKKFSALTLAMMLAGGAQAAYIFDDGFIGTTGSTDFVDEVDGNDGPISVNVYLGQDLFVLQDLKVTFTAEFREADWESKFISGDNELSNARLGESFSRVFTVGDNPMDFMYSVLNTGKEVKNGNNFAQYEESMLPTYGFAKYGDTYYLGLNDDGSPLGSDLDFDVDDFVVSFTVETVAVNVPEPSTSALLGLGLIGVGLSRMNRKKQ